MWHWALTRDPIRDMITQLLHILNTWKHHFLPMLPVLSLLIAARPSLFRTPTVTLIPTVLNQRHDLTLAKIFICLRLRPRQRTKHHTIRLLR